MAQFHGAVHSKERTRPYTAPDADPVRQYHPRNDKGPRRAKRPLSICLAPRPLGSNQGYRTKAHIRSYRAAGVADSA